MDASNIITADEGLLYLNEYDDLSLSDALSLVESRGFSLTTTVGRGDELVGGK